MIARWTVRTTRIELASTLASVAGIGASLLIVLLVDGMFAGESERIVTYLEHTRADVWVMQRGVANVHMASSVVSDVVMADVQRVPGVAHVTPLLYTSGFLEFGGQRPYSYIVGMPTAAKIGGPWSMAAGSDRPPHGGAIVPDVLATQAHVRLGDPITLLDRPFTVTGISSGTYSMANSVTFLHYDDLASLLRSHGATSYLLVEASSHTSPAELAARIRAAVPDVNALPRVDLVERDRRLALQMGVDVVHALTGIAAMVAALVVAFTVQTSVVRRTREFGVVKAIGVRPWRLIAAMLLHTVLLSILGLVAAVMLAFLIRPLIVQLMPMIALHYRPSTIALLASATVGIAIVAALLPALRVTRVDPALSFRE